MLKRVLHFAMFDHRWELLHREPGIHQCDYLLFCSGCGTMRLVTLENKALAMRESLTIQ